MINRDLEVEEQNQHTGYIAFLDVLGFTDRIRRENFFADFARYTEIIAQATQVTGVPYLIFSDTIVLYTIDDDEESLKSICCATAEIVYRVLVACKVPICGCISHGEFAKHESHSKDIILAGRPIVEAYAYEEKQNWIGVMLSPTLVAHASWLMDKIKSIEAVREVEEEVTDETLIPFFQREGDHILGFAAKCHETAPWWMLVAHHKRIPFKRDDRGMNYYEGLALVPQVMVRPAEKERNHWPSVYTVARSQVEALRTVRQLRVTAPSPSVQLKYTATEDFLRDNVNRFHCLSQGYWMTGKPDAFGQLVCHNPTCCDYMRIEGKFKVSIDHNRRDCPTCGGKGQNGEVAIERADRSLKR